MEIREFLHFVYLYAIMVGLVLFISLTMVFIYYVVIAIVNLFGAL